MLLCSVRARHDALGSVAEGIGCYAVVVRRKLELSLSYAPVRWTTMACEENVPTGPAEFMARLEDSSTIRLTRVLHRASQGRQRPMLIGSEIWCRIERRNLTGRVTEV